MEHLFMHRLKELAFVLILLSANLIHARTSVDYGPKWTSPSDELVTPHIKWQKPSANGSLNVLFITCKKPSGMREAVELRQRFDMNLTVFALEHRDKFYYTGPIGEDHILFPEHPSLTEMEDDLLKKLETHYDVVVLADIKWDALPLWARYRLLKKVSEGTGLVGTVSGHDEYLQRATAKKSQLAMDILLPFKGLPAFAKHADINNLLKNTVEKSQFGKGEILLLKGYRTGLFQPLTPAPIKPSLDVKPIEYDYYMAYIGHLLIYAGKKNGTVHIKGDDFVIRDRQDKTPFKFILKSENSIPVNIKTVLRTADSEIVQDSEKHIELVAGNNQFEFNIEKIPAGDYFMDVWVLSNGKTAAYGSAFLQLKSSEKIDKIDLPPVWEKGETINLNATIENPSGQWVDLQVVVERRDNLGRLTGTWRSGIEDTQGNKKELSFALPPATVYSIVQYIDIVLMRNNEARDKKMMTCSVRDFYPEDDLRSVIWGYAKPDLSYLSMSLCREWYRAGFDSHFTFFNIGLPLANLWHIPYATRLYEYQAKDTYFRNPALNDPAYRKRLSDILLKSAKETAPYGTKEFSLGNECSFSQCGRELCFAATSKAFFRKFLEAEYGNINKLNAEYESTYKCFDEIEPVLTKDAESNRKLIPLWVDFRRAMESQWAEITCFSGETLKTMIPEAKVGYDGDYFMNSLSGADYYKTARVNQMNSIYEKPFTCAALRDFCTPGTLIGMGWDGGYNKTRSNEYQRAAPWGRVFAGANILWAFNSSPGSFESIVAPDFSYYDFFKTYMKELKELKAGIGKLLITAKRSNDGIGVMYSASSVHAATMTAGFPQMEPVIHNLCKLLDDSGFQYRAVAYKQVSDGMLATSGIKVLFLPYVQALSRKEGEEIRRFVSEGGMLVADLRPGVCDEHGKPYNAGLLDDVFGIKQKTDSPLPKQGIIKITANGFPSIFQESVIDTSLELTLGRAEGHLDGMSDKCMIFNSYGKGKTLLLNFSLSKYYEGKDKNQNALQYVDFMQKILASIGINQPVRMAPQKGKLKISRFESGTSLYIGLLEELPEPIIKYAMNEAQPLRKEWVTLTLSRKGHIYDVKKGRYIGYGNEIKSQIEPADAQLYSVIQYKVQRLEVKIPATIKQGEVVKYEIVMSAENEKVNELHIIRIELVAPDGSIREYYNKNIAAKNGKASSYLELALNELPGCWKLIVKDIGTGLSTEAAFIVKAR